MASNINPFNIDGSFPVAGQDNSSQGFRDNFTNIRNNLGYAKAEIEDIQNKAVLKSGLTGQPIDNNMAGSTLVQPTLKSYYEAIYDQGSLSGTIPLFYTDGNVQKVTSDGPCTLAFDGWPASGVFGKITFWFSVTDISHTMSFAVTNPGVTIGLTDIAGCNPISGVVTFDNTGDYLFEFSTIDGGQNIMIRDLSRGYSTFRDTGFYYNPQVNNTVFVGYNNGLLNGRTNIESDQNNQISALGSYNAATVGNLTVPTVGSHVTDTGTLGGYSITAARGNLMIDGTFGSTNAVSNGDYLGFVEAVAFTGTGAGNAFTQVSSINFNATGANVSYGLGGNVSVFTKSDGGGLSQAIGIENDQSTVFHGNVVLGSWYPTSSTSTGVPGQFAWASLGSDQQYIFICVAQNSWKRISLSNTVAYSGPGIQSGW